MKYVYPLLICFLSFAVLGQEPLTFGEIYDYDVGDEFHVEEGGPGINSEYEIMITSKFFSADLDTVYYGQSIIEFDSGLGTPPWGLTSFYTDTVWHTNLDGSPIGLDTIYSDDDLYNGRIIQHYVDTGFFQNPSDFQIYKYWYAVGLGDPKYRYQASDPINGSSNYSTTLVYFYKSSTQEEWGTRLALSTIETVSEATLKIFPNPSHGLFNWEFQSERNSILKRVSIYNHHGELLRRESLNPDQSSLDLSDMPAGYYLMELMTEQGIIQKRIALY
jgi:hypothetical protein